MCSVALESASQVLDPKTIEVEAQKASLDEVVRFSEELSSITLALMFA